MLSSLSSLSPQRRRLALGVLALAAVALVAAAGAVVARPDGRPTRAAQDRAGPVLLVPGYGGDTASLTVLARRLQAAGRTAVVVALPGDGTGDLREAARALGRVADAQLRAGEPSVDVVGYSAGGVTARVWAAEQGGAARARRIVTLGSPQHGTQLAALGGSLGGCPTACRQLAPDSELLAGLNAGDETPDGPRWTSVWTRDDELVQPPDSARLDGATNVVLQDVCPGLRVAHGELPGNALVEAVVLAALGGDPPASFAPGSCTTPSSPR